MKKREKRTRKVRLRTVHCRLCGQDIKCAPGNTTRVLTFHYRDEHGKNPPRF